jgi:hypothetical protein
LIEVDFSYEGELTGCEYICDHLALSNMGVNCGDPNSGGCRTIHQPQDHARNRDNAEANEGRTGTEIEFADYRFR